MVYLQAYFDESGKIADHGIISFCGFAGDATAWHLATREWTRLMGQVGLKHFKASEVLKYRRPLSRGCPATGVEERTKALIPFVNALRDNLTFGIAIAADCDAFKAMPEAHKSLLGNDLQHLVFRQAMVLILHRCKIHIPDPDIHVALICDEEEKYSVQSLQIWTRLRKDYPELRKFFVSIGFGDDEYYPQLQAADFIASIGRQEADRIFHNKPFDMRGLYEALKSEHDGRAPVFGKFIDADLLSKVAAAEKEGRARTQSRKRK